MKRTEEDGNGMDDSATRMILASASPRRRDLLTQAGYAFDVVPSDVDETAFSADGHNSARYAEVLALAKARSVAAQHPDRIVLGADTIVDCAGEIIGKPVDERDAERITRKLFSRPHEVITGLALVRLADGVEIVRSDVTTVYPRTLSDEQIAGHLAGRTWEGKAGAYAIQETGDEFVERIEGSLTNVVGLPMELLEQALADIPHILP
ncbi:Maf family protein [Anaerobaca lacustris]|uniref:dTTP/UTP pyrophosphatase n=1 Tax=Anaerobaca lacustris TaxID=3044600 RepID=A0AAW6TWZ9_9BACT|nr:nucleoside triphosphate pyrophosphatase [Sedimentisphaerales bacterium M17dextr]